MVPERLRQHLTEAQTQGAALAIEAIEKHGGFLLADGTGVGKTRQQLAVAQKFLDQGKKVVIVSPAEVIKPDWAKGRMSGSFAHDSEAMGVPVKLAKGDEPLTPGRAHVTTYNELGKLKDVVDDNTVVIFDESHSMKNPESARSKHGKEIASKAAGVMYATATPGDKPLHIVHLARAGVFGNIGKTATLEKLGMELHDQHIGRGEYRKVWRVNPKVGYGEAMRRIAGLFDQMTKEGFMVKRELSMDGVAMNTDHVAMTPEQHDEISRVYDQTLRQTDGNKAVALMAARLHQEPMKIPATVDMVREELASGRRPVIFLGRVNDITEGDGDGEEGDDVRSAGTAKALKDALIKAGIPEGDIGELHGGATKTAQQKRKAMENFQAGKSKVMIATIQSGGTGINLDDTTGNSPRTVIMVTPPFTANDMAQAVGRIHRLNTKSQSKIRAVLSDTAVDQWNASVLENKFRALGAIAGGESARSQAAYQGGELPAELTGTEQKPYEWGESLVKVPRHYFNTPYSHNDVIRDFGGKRVMRDGQWTTEFPSKEHFERYQTAHAPKQAAPATASSVSASAQSRSFDVPDVPTTQRPPMSGQRKAAIHQALKTLAANDIDRAREINGVGFNKFDGEFGARMADLPELSDEQAHRAADLLAKYRRQLGDSLADQVAGKHETPAEQPVATQQMQAARTVSITPKEVQTSRGKRFVYSIAAGKSYWDNVHKKKPDYVSVRKNDRTGQWEVSVWGNTPEETAANYEDLVRRMGNK